MNNIFRHIFATLALSTMMATSIDAQVVTKKEAVNNYDGTYTLTMEAYATGNESVVVTTNKTPIDAVLVLDVSGSMSYNISSTSTSYLMSTYTLSDIRERSLRNSTSYYIYWSDGKYYQITTTTSGSTTTATFTVGSTKYGVRYAGTTYSVPEGYTEVPEAYRAVVLHTKNSGRSITRLNALKEACSIFLNNLKLDQEQWNAEHPDKAIEHRVSIITFASSSSTKVTLANGSIASNYSSLISNISSLSANGATRADLGMSNAVTQIKAARSGASKLTLFFTDGTPTSQNSFEETVASNAINYSNTIKNAGASVFSLTVVNWTADSNEDKFLNYISSNYPSATSMTSIGTKASSDFYSIATNQDQLNHAFDAISGSAISGGTSASIDATSVIQDVVSESFTLPAGAESKSIKVYTDDFKELQSGVYVFQNKLTAAGLTPTISGKKITVSGFDYKGNYCGYRIKKDSNGNIQYESDGTTPQTVAGGKKLVMVVTIVPDPDADSNGSAATNDDSQSGVYTSDGTVVQNFVTVPSTVYTNADLTIKVTGLEANETAIFTVTADVPLNMYGSATAFTRTVAITGASPSVVVKAPVTYLDSDNAVKFVKYTVSPKSSWSWTYTVEPDATKEISDNISDSSVTKSLIKVQDDETRVSDNIFEFKATKKTGLVVHGEGSKENDFQWRNDSSSSSSGSGNGGGSGSGSI